MTDPSESPPPPLFLDQNEARVQEKKILRERAFPLSQGLDDRPPPLPLSKGMDPLLTSAREA